MWVLIVLAIVLGSGFLTTLLLSRLGVQRRSAVLAGIATGIIEGVLLVALFIVVFGECLGENPDPPPPLSYPWSPRRQFCDDTGSTAQLGALALFLVPPILIGGGALLRARGQRSIGLSVWAMTLAIPFLPSIYVHSLPYYRLDSYPVLHQPLLRPAQNSTPPRVCYVYGIASGPRALQVTADTPRICIELDPTPEAMSLTTGYDEGRTIYDLGLVGDHLTENGLPVEAGPTGVDGLTVNRIYELPDAEARKESQVVE
jgi:hypothetical protein